MTIEKYSFGIGDRFGFEGAAQLRALQRAEEEGVVIVPVWNKSNREHSLIGTLPGDTRRAADEAVAACGWRRSYYVDADHIGLATVGKFLDASDFFTIDVADSIGKDPGPESVKAFLKAMDPFRGTLRIPGIELPLELTDRLLLEVAQKYLSAVEESGNVYRSIAERKGEGSFVTEISVDEAATPQSPAELFLILAAIAREKIPLQTIAPKFTGAFLKGVDYVGNLRHFEQEFEDDLAVAAFAVETFNLPRSLKLSVHSGSDKFSLYPIIHHAIKKFDAGLHVKTAGTTWLEEVIGLAASGGEGLKLMKELYAQAVRRYDELCKPYRTVIDIDKTALPRPNEVESWTAEEYVEALRHNQESPRYNRHFRQLIHVSFRVAAEMGRRYLNLLRGNRHVIESNVTANLFDRHLWPLFFGQAAKSGTHLNGADHSGVVTDA